MPPILEVRDLTKSFPGVKALAKVSLRLHRGEVLAVIGENGAGKSTLMKILAGVQPSDAGEILLDGRPVAIGSVREATALGIALIHQELNLADNLDAGANIFLGREPRRWGVVNEREIRRESKALLNRLGLEFSPGTPVRRLSMGRQQMVEIAKALSVNARVLIMDEPTSSLSQGETEHLYKVIDDLRVAGVSIIYISHRLGEVKRVADRVVVLRDGRNAGELQRHEIERDAMVRLMVGREVARRRERARKAAPGEIVLEVEALRTSAHPAHPVSFSVRAGEVVGIAGLVGAGRTELLETIFGVRRPRGGHVRLLGRELTLRGAREAIRAGVALAPEDRKQQGLIVEMAVRENMSLASVWRDQRRGFLSARSERALSREMIDRLQIKTPDDRQVVQYLSGGNQQKVVLGKWLALRPRVLLLDEPTRGIDVGAKGEVYALIERLAEEGVAVVFVSSEMEEILSIADRILVMHEGAIAGELEHEAATEEGVMQLATGGVTR